MAPSDTLIEDSFDTVFDELSGGPKPGPMIAPEAPSEPEIKAEGEADLPKEPEAKVEGETDPPEKPEEKAPEPEVKPAPTTDEILDRLADRLKPAEVVEPKTPAEPDPPVEIYTADEKAFLEAYEKDWPDVHRAEALRRRAEYRGLLEYAFQEVFKVIAPIQAKMEQVDALAERAQLTDLTAAIPDYTVSREKVVDWVAAQPAYLRSAYEQVIKSGTKDEVVDLIGRWRKDTGSVVEPKATPARKTDTELPPAAKQAAAALAPVSSKRSTVSSDALDPNNFEAAFEAFAGKV